ncbi:hypothetical protein ACTHGU_10445 [Chitinophagaceae bacterium MMS25-I14]
MKRFTYTAALICSLCYTATAQVNIGSTSAPNANAMLQVTGGGSKGFMMPSVALTATNSASPLSAFVAGMTVYNTATAGTSPNNVTPGFYYSDGTQWYKMVASGSGNDKNIYEGDGTLTGNRTVTQGANTLSFTSTATNGFSVDGTTFSIDAANNRVGVGTSSPGAALHVNGNVIVGSAASTNGATGFSTVVRDNTTGELKVASSSTGNTFPLNYVTYQLNTVQQDWISDFNTNISTSQYTVAVVGSSFNVGSNHLVTNGGNLEYDPFNVYAFQSGGTWHLSADFPNSGTTSSVNGSWTIYCLVINNSIIKSLGTVTSNLSGGSTGSASAPAGL